MIPYLINKIWFVQIGLRWIVTNLCHFSSKVCQLSEYVQIQNFNLLSFFFQGVGLKHQNQQQQQQKQPDYDYSYDYTYFYDDYEDRFLVNSTPSPNSGNAGK